MSISIGMLVFFIVLIIAAFFVMAEFVLVRIRPTRIDFIIEKSPKKGKLLRKMTSHLDAYLSATQLGVSVTSLALGWLGDPTFKKLFDTLFTATPLPNSVTTILSVVVSFSLLTFLQVIIGELVPKNFAINKTEKIALLICRPLQFWYQLMYPIIFVLNGTANGISHLFGLHRVSDGGESALSEEEIRLILNKSLQSGEINHEEFQFVENVFQFDNLMSREIMVPRTDMVTVSINMTLKEISHLVKEKKYTRYPVIGNDKDTVLGLMNTKEIFAAFVAYTESGETLPFDMRDYLHPIISVIETIPIKELLVKMQKERSQMAILVDEYGGTSGMVAMEDIIEEIVGDINDDYGDNELPEISKIDTNHYLVSARISINDINDLFQLDINEENVDTLGGWLLNEKYDIQVDESIDYEGYRFTVKKIGKNTLQAIEIEKLPKETIIENK